MPCSLQLYPIFNFVIGVGNQRYRNFGQRPGWLGVVEVGPEAEALVLGLPPEVPR